VKPDLFWQKHIRGWDQSRQRNRQNADAMVALDNALPHPIWMKLRVMYTLNATAFDGLIEKASGPG
jgi:hypothetical protein